MHFKKLEINHWQQFEKISIDFHERLTVLTGANASGKTTISNFLANHVGWHCAPLSTPIEDKSTGSIKYSPGFFKEQASKHINDIGKIQGRAFIWPHSTQSLFNNEIIPTSVG